MLGVVAINVNQIIMQALSEINMSVSAETSLDATMPYINFNVTDDRGTAFSDDTAEYDKISVQVHLFTKLGYDYIDVKKQIRKKLHETGFSYPSVTTMNDDDYNHIIFECEIALESEVNE